MEHYLDHDARFRQKVREGLEQLDRGDYIGHDEVGKRIGQLFGS